MDRNTIRGLHSKTVKDLQSMVLTMRRELVSMQVEKGLKKQKNTHLFTSKRQDLARVLTILFEKGMQDKAKEKKS